VEYEYFDGNTGTNAVTITVLSGFETETSMHVSDISMDINYLRVNSMGSAVVEIVDADGNPVENVLVSGAWSGVVKAGQPGITTSNGIVIFSSPKMEKSELFVFTIETVSAAGYSYYPEKNTTETWDSVYIP